MLSRIQPEITLLARKTSIHPKKYKTRRLIPNRVKNDQLRIYDEKMGLFYGRVPYQNGSLVMAP